MENTTINIIIDSRPNEHVHCEIVDEAVGAFAAAMQSRLDEVAGKPGKTGWENDDKKELFTRLHKKILMLQDALSFNFSRNTIRELCVDIGNYAMMIADNEGRLRG